MPREIQNATHICFHLTVCMALILGITISFTANGHGEDIEPEETTNQLIYKPFGSDSYPGPLPGPCVENCDQDSTPYYKPVENPVPSLRSGLEEIATPGMWPYTPTVKIFSYWPSGAVTACSGMLVDALTLVSAGQCVFTHQSNLCPVGEDSCWVDDIEAVPAYDDGTVPFGESGYRTILTWTAWTEAGNSDYDLAAVQLRYPIGAYLGWLGIGFTTDDAFFLSNEFSSTSYPETSPYNGENMAGWTGVFSEVHSECLVSDDPGDTGQVGASYYGANAVVYGVLSNPDGGGESFITRITYDKFAAIGEFIELGQPKNALDLAVFDVHARPLWNIPGQTLAYLDFYLQNYSTNDLPESVYNFNVYLSPDQLITDDDIPLGSVTYTGSLPANTGIRLTFTSEAGLTFPAEIHGDQPNGGIFYVGVISTLADANELNNRSDYFQPEPIWVNDSDNIYTIFPIVFMD